MYHIDNELLLEVYTKALELKLEDDFIELLEEEIEKREKCGTLCRSQKESLKVLQLQC
ncbi:sporulation histidine kinase inhibitor Sda [Alkalihalobacterium elongatum]|uniref:sporulation histidine kinase inhibitor Sda n=1 Tax=Alkalihalobacterium elongatum TaxID=2675466 RepID=UPI001C1F7DE5|nr:sporulation histidine kinase inhibitor Sda [Alkalihalobacterium elongatum]